MKRQLIIILTLIAFLAPARAQEVLTLDSCLSYTRQRNLTLQSARLDIQAAEYLHKEVFTKFFPQVNLTGIGYTAIDPIISFDVTDLANSAEGHQLLTELYEIINDQRAADGLDPVSSQVNLMQTGYLFGARATQPIFAGTRIINGYRLSQVGVEAAQAKAEISERDILQQVEEYYRLIQGLKEKRQTVASALSLIDEVDKVAATALAAGLVTRNDILRVDLKRNEIQAQQLQLENGIRLASKMLYVLMDRSYNGEPILDELPTVDIPSEATLQLPSIHIESRPEYSLLDMNIRAEQLRRKMTVGEALPTLAIGGTGSFSHIFSANKANVIGFALLTVPLTQWGEQSYKIHQQDIKIRQAQLMQEELTQKMRLQNEQAFDALSENAKLMQSNQSAVEKATENYRLTLMAYQAGTATMSELLESQTLLMVAQNNYTDAHINYLNAKKKFENFNQR